MIDEGYIKFDLRWTEAPPLDCEETKNLNRWRQPLFAAGLIGHYKELGIGYGNLSVRCGDADQFLISATQTGHIENTAAEHYALVTAVDLSANTVWCRGPRHASSESMTHAAIYALDQTIRAVVHVHDDKLWSQVLESIPATRADIAYGTPEMAQDFARLYRDTAFRSDGIAAMAGHDAGLVAIGSSVEQAARRILEFGDRMRSLRSG